MNILIVEDDPKIAESLQLGLVSQGHQVTCVDRGEDGFFEARTREIDLMILDWMLPGRDGLDVIRAVQKSGKSFPILMLTAKDAVEDRVQGLDAGADDYLVKPFAFPELLARIRALVRRSSLPTSESERLVEGDLELDPLTRAVHRGGEAIALTLIEFDILTVLLRHRHQIVSREMLARSVWPEQIHNASLNNVIDVHIGRLRKKIEAGSQTKLLKTVRGLGFLLKADAL